MLLGDSLIDLHFVHLTGVKSSRHLPFPTLLLRGLACNIKVSTIIMHILAIIAPIAKARSFMSPFLAAKYRPPLLYPIPRIIRSRLASIECSEVVDILRSICHICFGSLRGLPEFTMLISQKVANASSLHRDAPTSLWDKTMFIPFEAL